MALQFSVPPIVFPDDRSPSKPFDWLEDLDHRSVFLDFLVRYLRSPGAVWQDYVKAALAKYWHHFPFKPPKLTGSIQDKALTINITNTVSEYKKEVEKRVRHEFTIASWNRDVYDPWAVNFHRAFPLRAMVLAMESCVEGENGQPDFVPFSWAHILLHREQLHTTLVNYLRHPEQPIHWRGHPSIQHKHQAYVINFVRYLFQMLPTTEKRFKMHLRFGRLETPSTTIDLVSMTVPEIKMLFYEQVRLEFARCDNPRGLTWANTFIVGEWEPVKHVLEDVWPRRFWPHDMGVDDIATKAVTATEDEMAIIPESSQDYYHRFGSQTYTAEYLQHMDL
ncbi:hypothetical protein C8J56DRAFT_1031175 [Mycena floridula]|nr:hypothetical protein C8J56DRAFT_1031175 [Mycena floridula]